MRIGNGFDVHRLVDHRPLILGGVQIPYAKGLAGHSDADVLLHAICDALLGAAGLGDIGEHFPDSDPAYLGIDSLKLLQTTFDLVRQSGLRLVNLDATVLAQAPKIGPYKAAMREKIAAVLDVPPERINIKATTTEGVGPYGRGEAIGATCSLLMRERAKQRKP
ncbi:MAG: 2-C-methyl-D-erythritol 2,4-cyclodiphosphate synthase [Desulfosarcinaceae bacterium]|nr:2-C-methyl-D-erythritol 2,4-cyclodiphosphate synthase [Desulfosarcinaceae bacterium]